MISKILVPIDGSQTATKAAAYAIDIAKHFKASIIILTVIEKHPLTGKEVHSSNETKQVIEPIGYYLREAAQQFAADIKKLCDENNVTSAISIRTGNPVREIVKEAKRSGADLIVMGSHGKNALSAAILGSVSYGVIHHAKNIHVLIARG
jgi:nucleotide-binding universal stress UspA family protein